jgi:hypothetical protein
MPPMGAFRANEWRDAELERKPKGYPVRWASPPVAANGCRQ